MDHDHSGMPIDPDLAPSDPAAPGIGHTTSPGRPRDRARPDVLAAIALGGMIGAAARYGVVQLLPTSSGRFPWATFLINLAGSFLLGLLLVVLLDRPQPNRYVRPFLATGVLGAFTTMSAYQLETALLVKDGHPLTAVVYGVGNIAAGLALAYAGLIAGQRVLPRPATAA